MIALDMRSLLVLTVVGALGQYAPPVRAAELSTLSHPEGAYLDVGGSAQATPEVLQAQCSAGRTWEEKGKVLERILRSSAPVRRMALDMLTGKRVDEELLLRLAEGDRDNEIREDAATRPS